MFCSGCKCKADALSTHGRCCRELLKTWMRDVVGVNKGRSTDAPRGKGWDAASKRAGRLWEEKEWDAAREHAGMLWRRKGWDGPKEGAGRLPERKGKNIGVPGREDWYGPREGKKEQGCSGDRRLGWSWGRDRDTPWPQGPASPSSSCTTAEHSPPLLAPSSLPFTSHRPIPLPALHR